jgi:hypothetical protein
MTKSFAGLGVTIIDASADLPSSPVEGLIVYQKDTNELKIYDGTNWIITNDLDNTNGVPSSLNPFFAGYSSWTPTIGQGATTNITKSSTKAFYMQVGKFVHGYFEVIISGTGTAGNRVNVSLPVNAKSSGFNVFTPIGACNIYNASNVTVYPGFILFSGDLIVSQNSYTNGSQYLGINNFGEALANGDYIGGSFTYEAA